MRDGMVHGLHLGRLRQAFVVVQDGLGEARGATAKVDGRVVVLKQRNLRVVAGAQRLKLAEALGPRGAVVAHVEQQAARLQLAHDALHTANELRPKQHHVGVGLLHAVENLVCRVAEVERYGRGARLQDAEVDGQPLDAVVQQDGHLVALAHAARDEQVGKAVCLLVEDRPRDFATVRLIVGRLNQIVLTPGDVTVFGHGRVDLYQRNLVGVLGCVEPEHIGNDHGLSFLLEAWRAVFSARTCRQGPTCRREAA